MNKQRLLKLADLLEADAKNKKGIRFDIATVGSPTKGWRAWNPAIDCGTSACAMGIAALSGKFDGLSYENRTRELWCVIENMRVPYFTAAQRVFGISSADAIYMFSPSSYTSKEPITGARGERYVAKRIRDFVAGKVSPNS